MDNNQLFFFCFSISNLLFVFVCLITLRKFNRRLEYVESTNQDLEVTINMMIDKLNIQNYVGAKHIIRELNKHQTLTPEDIIRKDGAQAVIDAYRAKYTEDGKRIPK